MVILMLHMALRVHSTNLIWYVHKIIVVEYVMECIHMDARMCNRVEKTECVQELCYIWPGLLAVPVYGLYWREHGDLVVYEFEKNAKQYFNVHPHSLLVWVFLSFICAYSFSMHHFLFLFLHEALKSCCCRPQICSGRRMLHHQHVLYILKWIYSDAVQHACKAWSMLIDWAARRH